MVRASSIQRCCTVRHIKPRVMQGKNESWAGNTGCALFYVHERRWPHSQVPSSKALAKQREGRSGVQAGAGGGRSLTFSSAFPFFLVFGFPANKLWISWGFFILLKLLWPPACAGRSLCLHKIPLLSARSPGLRRNH